MKQKEIDRIYKKVRDAIDQFGLIEEGEGMELAYLQYQKDTISRQLYPLRPAYIDSALKTGSYGDKNIVLKGGLE